MVLPRIPAKNCQNIVHQNVFDREKRSGSGPKNGKVVVVVVVVVVLGDLGHFPKIDKN